MITAHFVRVKSSHPTNLKLWTLLIASLIIHTPHTSISRERRLQNNNITIIIIIMLKKLTPQVVLFITTLLCSNFVHDLLVLAVDETGGSGPGRAPGGDTPSLLTGVTDSRTSWSTTMETGETLPTGSRMLELLRQDTRWGRVYYRITKREIGYGRIHWLISLWAGFFTTIVVGHPHWY